MRAAPETVAPGRAARFWRGASLALLAVLVLGWLATSVWRLQRTEEGVVLRFGRAARVVPPGVHLTLPWPVETLVRVPTTAVRTLGVGFRAEGQAGEAASYDPAAGAESLWLTGDTNIVELQLLVQYTVEDPVLYLTRVARSGGDESVVRPVAEAVVTEIVAGMPIDELLAAGKTELGLRARSAIQERLDELGYGVRLAGLNIAEAAPPAQVIGAFNDVTSAASDREREISEADGFRRDLLPTERARANREEQEARQYADQVVQEARGRAQSFLALLAEVDRAPEATRRRLWLERVTEILSRGRRTVYPADGDGRFRYRIVD